jgi:hypothetical protein
MVQLKNIVTILAAGSAVVSANTNERRTFHAAGQQEVRQAVESYAGLLSNLANNMQANGKAPTEAALKDGLDSFMGIMGAMKELQLPAEGNATAWTPNWEGAAIGGLISAQFGLLAGALLGANTAWTFDGFQKGLTNALGFDPVAALMGTPPIPTAPEVPISTAPAAAAAPAIPARPAAPMPAMGMMGGHAHGGH